MARTITSPGVQITEKELALRVENPTGPTVVVPGFASQGPVAEPITITTLSELESIYGTPTTQAEKYFYYTCKEVLNSPGVLTTLRLPYGSGAGAAFSNAYSGLFYPMTSGVDTTTGELSSWDIGEPIHHTFTKTQYNEIVQGNFTWGSDPATAGGNAAVALGPNHITAGFFILNDLQTIVNEAAEGYYIGLGTNGFANTITSPDFDVVTELVTLSAVGSPTWMPVSDTKLDFALSATAVESLRGVTSVSEVLEKAGFAGFEQQYYADHLAVGVFRVRQSIADSALMSLAANEKYLGSINQSRKQHTGGGGALQNAFVEDIVNNASPTIKLYVNEHISTDFNWLRNNTIPTCKLTIKPEARKLFPLGVYTPDARAASSVKVIGDVPLKVEKVLRSVESLENATVDILTDAGLSTIYSMVEYAGGGTVNFDDTDYIPAATLLYPKWLEVAEKLNAYSEVTRKDCVTILDAPRAVFVSGKDAKIIDMEDRSFLNDIYVPLKVISQSFDSSYSCMYANWVKIPDVFTSKRMWVPFSGYAAAVFARSDTSGNPWSAPAGLRRGKFDVQDLAINPNQKQKDRLYELSMNPVVYMNGEGYVIMGQKTLQSRPTAFDRLNVRRLFLALERATYKSARTFVFEPNTSFTRTKLKTSLTPVFEFAKSTDGLFEYLIVCDERNNTIDNVDNNEMIVDIYVKPVRSAEFILVNFVATRTGQNFQELA